MVDQVFLEAHGLADDVRLHGGAADRTRQRANDMETKSGSREHSGFALIRRNCDGKQIEAENAYTEHAKVLLAEGVGTLAPRSIEELESMLRDLKKARGRVRVLIEETEALLPK